jgi:hypothetical protein
MEKSCSLAILTLGLACFLLFACQSAGTPKQSDGVSKKTQAVAGSQAPRSTDSVSAKSPKKTASLSSAKVQPIASPQLKNLKGKKVNLVHQLASLSKALLGQTKATRTLRTWLYASLAVIAAAVIGAIMADRATRRRKPARAVAS